jgi:primase-polymerase (primpol)-like protein
MVLDDAELVRRARSAANGEKFARLWNGDTSGYADGNNEGRSEADFALCSLLAFWCGPDKDRIDRLFRQSGLMRPKWDERHYGDGRTYGQGTIGHALAGRTEFWSEGASTMSAGKVYARRKGAIFVG